AFPRPVPAGALPPAAAELKTIEPARQGPESNKQGCSMNDETRLHPAIPPMAEQLKAGRIGRRDFIRTAALLGMAAPAAYALAGREVGGQRRRQPVDVPSPQGGEVEQRRRLHCR